MELGKSDKGPIAGQKIAAKARRCELAPLASFEDLDEFKQPKPSSNINKNCLAKIDDHENQGKDSTCIQGVSGIYKEEKQQKYQSVPAPQIVNQSNASHQSRPTSVKTIPTSVTTVVGDSDTVTPPTPRIDISCASSSSTISDDISSSERELLRYGLGVDCKEEVEDLRSSTEEIAFEQSSTTPDGQLDTKRFVVDTIRRSSHPANIFSRKYSTMTVSDKDFTRKPSVYSLRVDPTSSKSTSRHHSIATPEFRHPKSCVSSPTPSSRSGRRSASPRLMMFETSFCGSHPTVVDSETEVYSPHVTTTTAEVEVHSSVSDTRVDDPEPLGRRNSSTQTSFAKPSTSKAIKIIHNDPTIICERFVIPNQPSLDDDLDPDPDEVKKKMTNYKVRLDSDDQVNSNCTKDKCADFSDNNVTNKQDDKRSLDPSNEEVEQVQINGDDEDELQPPNLISPQLESKGLFQDDQDEDELELPNILTTLPNERSVCIPMVPVKDRTGYVTSTTPIKRPRSTQPPNPTTLEDYITTTATNINSNEPKSPTEKIRIKLPKEESLGDDSSSLDKLNKLTKKDPPMNWTFFAELGLRNPKTLRKQFSDESN